MNFLSLLGKSLKDDAIIEVLENYEIDVIYDFDRLHENTPDKYWAPAKKAGFQLGFDSEQRTHVIFLYISSLSGFDPIDQKEIDVELFSSPSDVERFCIAHGFSCARGRLGPGMILAERDWARIDRPSTSIHYDFRDGKLGIVTISHPWKK